MTDALGLGVDVPAPRPIAAGLFNTVPEAPPLTAPPIPGAGESNPVPAADIGARRCSRGRVRGGQHDPLLRSAQRRPAAGFTGGGRDPAQHQLLWPGPAAAAGRRRRWRACRSRAPSTPARTRSDPVALVDAAGDPVTCARWAKPEGATTDSLTLLSGAALPLAEGQRTVDLVTSGSGGHGQAGGAAARQRLFRRQRGLTVLDQRYRRPLRHRRTTKTVAALGLTPPPLPIPWVLLTQFAAGPTLSRGDALLAHDALPPDPKPARLETP